MIDIEGNRLTFVGCGSVEPADDLPLANRLLAIHEGLAGVLGNFQPAEAAVEQTFVNKDGVATLKLGQARGVAMLAPAIFGISGRPNMRPTRSRRRWSAPDMPTRTRFRWMLRLLLPKAEPKSADAADSASGRDHACHHRASAALRLKVVGI